MDTNVIVKHCPCCGRSYTAEGLEGLERLCNQHTPGGVVLALYNCTCTNTLAIPVEKAKDERGDPCLAAQEG
jgi:hypothetical protein